MEKEKKSVSNASMEKKKKNTLDSDSNPTGNAFIQLRSGKIVLKRNKNESMEKMKSKNEIVVSTYIPDDIAFSILSKLPLKSFKRFESVRKSWSLLFENTRFMNMFRNNFLSNSYYDGASLFLKVPTWPDMSEIQVLYALSGYKFQNIVKFDFSNPFHYNTEFQIFGFGSVNGTLLLHQHCRYKHALWHPATQKFKILPPSPFESYVPVDVQRSFSIVSYLHGFGYDSVTDDYKVIRYIFFPDRENDRYRCLGNKYFDPLWEMYSLRSNSWRKLDVDMPFSLECIDGTQVYMDGVCHWLCQKDYGCWQKHNNSPFQPCLVSFHLSNEVFFITPTPSDVDDCFDVKGNWINLVVLNGSIALFSYHEKTTAFHMSILGEIGMKDSWTNLFTIGPLPCVQRPIGVGTKGEIFFIRKDKELAWFDLSNQMIEELGFKVDMPECRITIYKESILPVGGIDN